MKKILSLALAALLLLAAPAPVAFAQSTPPENPKQRDFRDTAEVDIVTPPSSKARLFYDGGVFKFKKPDGSVVSLEAGGAAAAAGSDTQVQFNDGGVFGADSGFVFNKTTDTATLGQILTTGRGAIGTTINRDYAGETAKQLFNVFGTETGVPTQPYLQGLRVDLQLNNSSPYNATRTQGALIQSNLLATDTATYDSLYGAQIHNNLSGQGSSLWAMGLNVSVTQLGDFDGDNLTGIEGEAVTAVSAVEPLTTLTGIATGVYHNATTTVTNAHGFLVPDMANAGTFTNTYGIWIGDVTAGTQTNQAYGLYQSDANARNFFAGPVEVPTEVYGAGWDGDLGAPTKDALYDKIETLGGGGGTPGGADTQVQFNDGGAFGGDTGFVFDKTTDVVTAAGGFNAVNGRFLFNGTDQMRLAVNGNSRRIMLGDFGGAATDFGVVRLSLDPTTGAASLSNTQEGTAGVAPGSFFINTGAPSGGVAEYQIQTDSVTRWRLQNNGILRPELSDTYDIGTTTAKLRSIYHGSGIFGPLPVNAKTTAYTVTANESGRLFTNEGAGAIFAFTLPSAVTGLTYTFVVQDADGLQVTAGAGDTIRVAGNVTAAAGTIDSTTIGDVVTLVAINATEWVAISIVGTGF